MINKTRYADHIVCLSYPDSQTDSVSHCRLVDSAPKKYQNAGVRGLTETPLFVHVYTRGCWIYSQLAISENPKSYILPTVHENTMISYLLVWGIKHPPLPPLPAGLWKDFKSKSKLAPEDINPFQSGGLADEDVISVRPTFNPLSSHSVPQPAPITYPENLQCDWLFMQEQCVYTPPHVVDSISNLQLL